MSYIEDYITNKNKSNEKVLSVFLTSGFPCKNNFTELAVKILEAGADMLEIGFPFSDPLADGPIIQHSSQTALENGIDLKATFHFIKEIRKQTDKPLIMMGYANPVLSYGINKFADEARAAGVNGIIIPDIPIEEYDNFFDDNFNVLDKILLITPTTPDERIKIIDDKSSGFVYCVSVSGTTGSHLKDKPGSIEFIKRTHSVVNKNKTLVGFGISTGDDAKAYAPYCDGVIVGSAVIKSLMKDDKDFKQTLKLVSEIKKSLV
jgi:tryptophan synthase alpha chain